MSKLAKELHEDKLMKKFNTLNHQDQRDVRTSLSTGKALDYLDTQDMVRRDTGIRLYNKGKLTPELGKKMDVKARRNAYTTDVLTQATYGSYKQSDPKTKHIRIARKTIADGSFQKNIVNGLKHMQDLYSVNGKLQYTNLQAHTLYTLLHNASSKGFSKRAKAYLKFARQKPKAINTFTELAKIKRPKFQRNPNRNRNNNLKTKSLNKKHLDKYRQKTRHIDRGQGIE